ncbi:hypothetical protein [Planctomyces sp. SH-PL62]|nr:hypothetical protein [Planctomyces sp. SH-PL62]
MPVVEVEKRRLYDAAVRATSLGLVVNLALGGRSSSGGSSAARWRWSPTR